MTGAERSDTPTHEARAGLLRALTAPRGIALIGASASVDRLTSRPQAFLSQHGFAGAVYPVNPNRQQVLGLPAFRDIAAVPGPLDHAYVLIDTPGVEAAVEACAARGVPLVSVLADGFAESGPDGLARQRRLVDIAERAGITLLGPNSMGVVDTRSRAVCTTNAAFAAERLATGRTAVISQSGSLIGTLVSRGAARGIGFSTLVSVGNEAQTTVADIGTALLEDPGTDGFVLFLETLRAHDRFLSFARQAAALGKPITAYLIGQSEEGRALAVSHTGAMVGSDRAIDAVLEAAGVARVELLDTLIEAPAARAHLAPKLMGRARAVTVVSTTGGGGAMMIDQLGLRGVTVRGLPEPLRDRLTAGSIPVGHGKLVDVTLAGARYEVMRRVVEAIIADTETGLLVCVIGSSAEFKPELAVRPIVDAVTAAGRSAAPVVAFPLPHAPDALAAFEAGGIPAFRTLEACAETVAIAMAEAVLQPSVTATLPSAAVALLAGAEAGLLDEAQSRAIFEAIGGRSPPSIVIGPHDQVPEPLGLSYPVVAKLVSRDLAHKTELGAVRLDLADRTALTTAIDAMRADVLQAAPGARISGVLVAEMRAGLGELLIGLTRDPVAGPLLTIGMGGVFAEVYRDVIVRPAPLDVATARAMIDRLAGAKMLKGWRGRPMGDLEAAARLASAVSNLAIDPRVAEAEINPLLVRQDGVEMLDALIRTAPAGAP
ncbi:MAG: acetate--CoA ligase family protein [Hyphomicrobiaceae bacterium]